MYTSYIGKKFLKIYNEKEGKDLSAEEFFNEIFFPLFFQDDSHLMHVGNSPFFQKPKNEDVVQYGGKAKAQLNNLKTAILEDTPNMSIYVGSAAKDIQGTTSGQISSIAVEVDAEEMYASWIGEALAIGVSGRFGILLQGAQILWLIFKGWNYYRELLTKTPNLKDKEISFWNGIWLLHCFDQNFNVNNPWNDFNIETDTSHGETRLQKRNWSEIVFGLSKKYPSEIITFYSYQLDKMNTTLGFINVYLPDVRKVFEFRDAIFINKIETILSDKEIETLSTFYDFKSACQFGTIGLRSLEPSKLREYMPRGSILYAQGKDFKFTDEESFHNYQLYKIWITAMLNKTELLKLASQVSNVLLKIEAIPNHGKTVFKNLSNDVRESKNMKSFIDNLSQVLEETPENTDNSDVFKNVVEETLKMPSDNFPLFITLIRFEYNYQKTKN